MSGGIIFRQGGPVAWIAVRQERTSLSSCEAEICATNEVSKLLIGIRNLAESVRISLIFRTPRLHHLSITTMSLVLVGPTI
jgi:hypothetical protein